ncbi:polysaccharide deacetylase family protein [Pseudonocardia cypriaca]|uniref:Peptidoglycan/xylan/chitin deacetylase (PgdA/CDA1 family) n=1 Tax=Pseudonocardia cypriaca TaxID=882449 RepID=A0A543FV35_9PSEU|nr:polysaccharide deacetylase family protein [Pseudonocardia cypriaca]TQM37690.1 peptidoglycan/xylan/chitin deacetylase (PgdA/CDA1 family) [Pseudonocardia cypriaca]
MPRLRIVAAAVAVFLAAGCGTDSDPAESNSAAPAPAPAPVDPAQVQANELGRIPVLMYHRIITTPVSVYDRTPDDFRAELERLARENYVPVTTAEMAAGRIDIPAGAHPVVLTFDDGDPTQITLGPDGKPAPNSAVRILLDVAAAHPGFRPVASMYVNAEPFGGGPAGAAALRWLHDNGFEIGNHTFGHLNLRTASPEKARQDIARGDQAIRQAVPGYQPVTLALPFGARPRDPQLAARGNGYDYSGVLLVGANPAPSPFAEEFTPLAIPRIRSQGPNGSEAEFGSSVWLDKMAASPGTRYTSDGNPAVISYPTGKASPAAQYAAAASPY